MRKFTLLITVWYTAILSFSQAPTSFSYQSVIRDTQSELLVTTSVGIKISILKDGTEGTVVYTETHQPITNENGLVTLQIGNGTTSDDFSSIDWGNGIYFVKTEIDLDGGTSYTLSSVSQLLSVPYALYAENVKNKHPRYVGEEYLGGIIYYLYVGDDGLQHGLVVSTTESVSAWQSINNYNVAINTWKGSYNTGVMTNSPAKDWIESQGSEWYLPSVDELNILWNNRFHVNMKLFSMGLSQMSRSAFYWSSTEEDEETAKCISFSSGVISTPYKTNQCNVRAIKSF